MGTVWGWEPIRKERAKGKGKGVNMIIVVYIRL
jgi:hypothetical protein